MTLGQFIIRIIAALLTLGAVYWLLSTMFGDEVSNAFDALIDRCVEPVVRRLGVWWAGLPKPIRFSIYYGLSPLWYPIALFGCVTLLCVLTVAMAPINLYRNFK